MEKTINVDFSDSEEENNEELTNELPEEDEMDDEFRAYIYNLTCRESKTDDDDFFLETTNKKKKRERKKKDKKKLLVLDFNQDLVGENKSSNNTWKSKRLTEKKVDRKEYKFKPKKVPFEYRFKTETKSINFSSLDNETDFPSL